MYTIVFFIVVDFLNLASVINNNNIIIIIMKRTVIYIWLESLVLLI